jgi:hypothetical protein
MEFKEVLDKHKFEWNLFDHGGVNVSEDNKWVIRYEGYAYVLYKKIKIRTDSWGEVFEEPIAHFRDVKKLDIFLEIIFENFDEYINDGNAS